MDKDNQQEEEHRPWGYFIVLEDEPSHKVKRVVVYTGKRLSLQKHRHRAEHWFIVQGEGIVTIDSEEKYLRTGECITIPQGALHRVLSTDNFDLVIIEVQTGDYFGEDDIERLEDDFGRR